MSPLDEGRNWVNRAEVKAKTLNTPSFCRFDFETM